MANSTKTKFMLALALARQADLSFPEGRLYFAVLRQAIMDLDSPSPRYNTALQFLRQDPNIASFAIICGINPAYLWRLVNESGLIDNLRGDSTWEELYTAKLSE